MSECCSTKSSKLDFPKKHCCPVNGKEYRLISSQTIKHHIKAPWLWDEKEQGYYFCSDPDCSVAYFGLDNSIIEKSMLRTTIGLKEKSENELICYCFGVTKKEAKNNSEVNKFVLAETKKKQCACQIRNPSGKCCLSDFPKLQKKC